MNHPAPIDYAARREQAEYRSQARNLELISGWLVRDYPKFDKDTRDRILPWLYDVQDRVAGLIQRIDREKA